MKQKKETILKIDFLFKDLNGWTIKNGYYVRTDNQKIDSAWSSDTQDIFNDVFENSWWIHCKMKTVAMLINKYSTKQAIVGGGGGIGFFCHNYRLIIYLPIWAPVRELLPN
ncbi:MAG: hypothetical protein LBT79_08645, partial [Elusimicrobiota bacterium]|nr:hypothetical protein [Elusimicrobiota bacterium]